MIPSASTDARAWAEAYMGAWSAHDPAAVTAAMTEDVVYTDTTLDERLEGRAAVAEFVAGMEASLSSDHVFEVGAVAVDGETYAIEWLLAGTNDRANEAMGMPATGRRFRLAGVSVGRLRDGRIAENRDYWDMASYLQQVGLAPAPAAAPAG